MPEQDDEMSWFDKVKFFICMWFLVFLVWNVRAFFMRDRYHSYQPLSVFSVESAVITGVISLAITIFIMVKKTSDL